MTFSLRLGEASPRLWMLLGEACSKCEHIAGVPLTVAARQELHKVYLIKGVLATTAIEGNTLSEEQVRQRLDGKRDLPASKEYLGQEVDNIIRAVNAIVRSDAGAPHHRLDARTLSEDNVAVLQGLELEEGVTPGGIRTYDVVVGHYSGAPPQDCEYLLDRLCAWLNDDDYWSFLGSDPMAVGVLRAILAHLYLAWIHPFGDGNGRTARLLEFRILYESGVSSAAAHLLSNHYNQTRQAYYRQLGRASQARDPLPFMEYALAGFVDGLREQLGYVERQQREVTWRDYIRSVFRDRDDAVGRRRERLVLDLSREDEPVPVSRARELSPKVAQLYATKSPRILSRDIKELVRLGLVEETEGGLRARIDAVLEFLPTRRMTRARSAEGDERPGVAPGQTALLND